MNRTELLALRSAARATRRAELGAVHPPEAHVFAASGFAVMRGQAVIDQESGQLAHVHTVRRGTAGGPAVVTLRLPDGSLATRPADRVTRQSGPAMPAGVRQVFE